MIGIEEMKKKYDAISEDSQMQHIFVKSLNVFGILLSYKTKLNTYNNPKDL